MIVFHNRATITYTKSVAVDSDTDFENLGQSDMKADKRYKLADLWIRLKRTVTYTGGTAPADGIRELNFSYGGPGILDDPSSNEEKLPIIVDYDNDATEPFLFGDEDGQVPVFYKRIPLTGSSKEAIYTKSAPLSAHVTAGSLAYGLDADGTGGIDCEIGGIYVAV
jgi:hypothetical protein